MSVNSPRGPTAESSPEPEGGFGSPTGPTRSAPRLYRSQQDRLIAGVCGGLGQYFAIDPVIVRLAFVLLLAAGVGFLAYLVLWIVIPERPSGEVETFASPRFTGRDGREVFAWLLIFVGLVAFLGNLQLLRWLDWSLLWPFILIAIGVALLARHSAAN